MKCRAYFLLALFALFAASRVSLAFQEVDPFAVAKNPCSEIKTAKFVCLDCETLAFCTQSGGEWNVVELGKCDTERHFYCDENVQGCTLQNTCSVGTSFECQNPGIYPDPYNCKYYHVCNSLNQGTRYICPSGWAYSVATQTCSFYTTSSICTEPQYKCPSAGYRAAWPGDPNIFYICFASYSDGQSTLYPVLFRCPNGQLFDGDRCVTLAATGGGGSATSSTAGTKSDDNVAQPTCDKNTNTLIADPTDCQAYYACRYGELLPSRCADGYHFDAANYKCVHGTC